MLADEVAHESQFWMVLLSVMRCALVSVSCGNTAGGLFQEWIGLFRAIQAAIYSFTVQKHQHCRLKGISELYVTSSKNQTISSQVTCTIQVILPRTASRKKYDLSSRTEYPQKKERGSLGPEVKIQPLPPPSHPAPKVGFPGFHPRWGNLCFLGQFPATNHLEKCHPQITDIMCNIPDVTWK